MVVSALVSLLPRVVGCAPDGRREPRCSPLPHARPGLDSRPCAQKPDWPTWGRPSTAGVRQNLPDRFPACSPPQTAPCAVKKWVAHLTLELQRVLMSSDVFFEAHACLVLASWGTYKGCTAASHGRCRMPHTAHRLDTGVTGCPIGRHVPGAGGIAHAWTWRVTARGACRKDQPQADGSTLRRRP